MKSCLANVVPFINSSFLIFFLSEMQLSCWTSLVEEERDARLVESERIVGGLFETSAEKTSSVKQCNMLNITSPEMTFVSILRYGILALDLLPKNSSAGNLKRFEHQI